MRTYTQQVDYGLPKEYKGAYPLSMEYVELAEHMITEIGMLAQEKFLMTGWSELTEKAFILDNGSLLLLVGFPALEETHYIEVPQKYWRMRCLTTV